jgi:hypothetical protein
MNAFSKRTVVIRRRCSFVVHAVFNASASLGSLPMRSFSSQSCSPSLSKGVALDIDGVLLRGKTVLPRAVDALKLLRKEGIPHVFVTNGQDLKYLYFIIC